MSNSQLSITAVIAALVVGQLSAALAQAPALQKPLNSPFSPFALQRQLQALTAMPNVQVTYSSRGTVRSVTGVSGITLRETPHLQMGDDGSELLTVLKDILLATGTERLEVRRSAYSYGRKHAIRFRQSIRGLPVLDASLAIGFDPNTGALEEIHSNFLPDVGLPETPLVGSSAAIEIVEQALLRSKKAQKGSVNFNSSPRLAYLAVVDDAPYLVWQMDVSYSTTDGVRESSDFRVNAIDGSIVSGHSTVRTAISRRSYTGSHQHLDVEKLPTGLTLAGTESAPPTGDIDGLLSWGHARDAYDGWFQFGEIYGEVRLVFDISPGADGAQFKSLGGKDYLVFHEGIPGWIPSSRDRDDVAHEFGHGVFSWNVDAWSQISTDDGVGLDEGFASMSSVLADIVDRGGLPAADTWKFGQRLLADPSYAMMSWSNPRTTSATAVDWYPNRSSNRHANGVVLGYAFYLLSNGGQHYRAGQSARGGPIPSITVPKLGAHVTSRIFATALRDPRMASYPDYLRLRTTTEAAAYQWYGVAYKDAVSKAWDAVGVKHQCTAPPSVPAADVASDYCRGGHRVTWLSVPGAIFYEGRLADSQLPWDHSFPVFEVESGLTSCRFNTPGTGYFRMRACNGCGCSPWTPSYTVYYYSPCL